MTNQIQLNRHILHAMVPMEFMRAIVDLNNKKHYDGIPKEELLDMYRLTRDTFSRMPHYDLAWMPYYAQEKDLRRHITYDWLIGGQAPNNFHRDLTLRVTSIKRNVLEEICNTYGMPFIAIPIPKSVVDTVHIDITNSSEENFEEFWEFLLTYVARPSLDFMWRGISPWCLPPEEEKSKYTILCPGL